MNVLHYCNVSHNVLNHKKGHILKSFVSVLGTLNCLCWRDPWCSCTFGLRTIYLESSEDVVKIQISSSHYRTTESISHLWNAENLPFYKHPWSFVGILKFETHSHNTTSSFLRDVKLLVWAFWELISASLVQRVLYCFDFPEDSTIRMANFGGW